MQGGEQLDASRPERVAAAGRVALGRRVAAAADPARLGRPEDGVHGGALGRRGERPDDVQVHRPECSHVAPVGWSSRHRVGRRAARGPFPAARTRRRMHATRARCGGGRPRGSTPVEREEPCPVCDQPGGQTLERGAIGLTEVLFQSITHMAPAVATALSIGAATLFAGGNTPLAVVLALIAALFTAYSIGELARYLPSAGGMYTYVARGLGSFAGWLMAWAFLLAEPVVPAALFASFGLFGASLITLADRVLQRLPVAAARGPLRAHRLVARLPRHLDLDARRRRPRPDRDRHLPAASRCC